MSDHIEKLEHLVALKEKGAITEEEFQLEKNKILADKTISSVASTPLQVTYKMSRSTRILLFAIGVVVVLFIGLKSEGYGPERLIWLFSQHEGTPSSISTNAYNEEDSLIVYFILRNDSYEDVSSSGDAQLSITSEDGTQTIYLRNVAVKSDDFEHVERGFPKHDDLIYNFGKIAYGPAPLGSNSTSGKPHGRIKVDIRFNYQNGRKVLSDDDNVSF